MADDAAAAAACEALGPADAGPVYALHLAAIADIADRTTVKPEEPAFFEGLLAGRGTILGVREAGRLIAYGVLQHDLAAGDDPRDLLGLAADARVAKLAGVGVAPDRRGHGLQRRLTRARVALAAEQGFGHLFATAAPANPVSWGNLMSEGFAIGALVVKYGGLRRFLLHRRPEPRPPARQWIAADDLAGVAAALSDGLAGVAFCRRPGAVRFARDIGFAPREAGEAGP